MLPNIRRTLAMTARAAWRALYALFENWHGRRRTLRALADLNDRELRDIGLVRDDYDNYRPLSGVDDTKTWVSQQGATTKADIDDARKTILTFHG